MPRITKAEVRAAALKDTRRPFPVEKKERILRDEEDKESKSVSVKLERPEISSRDEKELQSSKPKVAESSTSVPTNNKNQGAAPTKRVNISNFDPTPIARKARLEESVVSKLREESESLSSEIEKLEQEKQKVLDEMKVQDNLISEIKEDNKRALELKDTEIQNKDEELQCKDAIICELNEQIKGLNEKLDICTEEKEAKNKKFNFRKALKTMGEVGILAVIGLAGTMAFLLICKLLIATVEWLF